ncbi:MAG: serine hydrolase [Mucilaginibacter polytrichastri]|nr:serine hydrolase [Mucilaginibacter polytrichastri]
MPKLFSLLIFCMISSAHAQQTDTLFLEKLLKDHPDYFAGILAHPQKNEVQILYTQIDRDAQNKPHFRTFSYRLNPEHYFYPASTVKLPTAIFALEKINDLHIAGLDKHTAMYTDSAFAGQTRVNADSTAANGQPSVAHYIRKILLTSDNDAFNRLFEFVDRAEINAKLRKYGCADSRILNRLAIGDAGETTRHTNPVHFVQNGKTIYTKPAAYDAKDYPLALTNLRMGKGYLDSADRYVDKPFDLSGKNAFPLGDQQNILKKLLFPESFPAAERFHLTEDDYRFFYQCMMMYPPESLHPKYDAKEFYPTYAKYLYYGSDSTAVPDPHIFSLNKYGDSYGFNIDNAYIIDTGNKVEFLLAAVVQSNEDGIYNDNKYEYETVCKPFLKNLGRVIYAYELKRKKKHLPDLSRFINAKKPAH